MKKGLYLGMIIMSLSCVNRYHTKSLMESKLARYEYWLPVADTTANQSNDQYCFRIGHEDAYDLDSFNIAIRMGNKVVYSGIYKEAIVVNFNKQDHLYTVIFYAYNPKKKVLFRWQNKDSYTLETYPNKCYRILLLGQKSINHSECLMLRMY